MPRIPGGARGATGACPGAQLPGVGTPLPPPCTVPLPLLGPGPAPPPDTLAQGPLPLPPPTDGAGGLWTLSLRIASSMSASDTGGRPDEARQALNRSCSVQFHRLSQVPVRISYNASSPLPACLPEGMAVGWRCQSPSICWALAPQVRHRASAPPFTFWQIHTQSPNFRTMPLGGGAMRPGRGAALPCQEV